MNASYTSPRLGISCHSKGTAKAELGCLAEKFAALVGGSLVVATIIVRVAIAVSRGQNVEAIINTFAKGEGIFSYSKSGDVIIKMPRELENNSFLRYLKNYVKSGKTGGFGTNVSRDGDTITFSRKAFIEKTKAFFRSTYIDAHTSSISAKETKYNRMEYLGSCLARGLSGTQADSILDHKGYFSIKNGGKLEYYKFEVFGNAKRVTEEDARNALKSVYGQKGISEKDWWDKNKDIIEIKPEDSDGFAGAMKNMGIRLARQAGDGGLGSYNTAPKSLSQIMQSINAESPKDMGEYLYSIANAARNAAKNPNFNKEDLINLLNSASTLDVDPLSFSDYNDMLDGLPEELTKFLPSVGEDGSIAVPTGTDSIPPAIDWTKPFIGD